MAVRTYSILVDDGAGVPLAELVSALRQAGVAVGEQLKEIGVVIGRMDDARVAEIRAIRGVAAVEEEREVGPAE